MIFLGKKTRNERNSDSLACAPSRNGAGRTARDIKKSNDRLPRDTYKISIDIPSSNNKNPIERHWRVNRRNTRYISALSHLAPNIFPPARRAKSRSITRREERRNVTRGPVMGNKGRYTRYRNSIFRKTQMGQLAVTIRGPIAESNLSLVLGVYLCMCVCVYMHVHTTLTRVTVAI